MQFVPVDYFYEPEQYFAPRARSPYVGNRVSRPFMGGYDDYFAQQEYLRALQAEEEEVAARRAYQARAHRAQQHEAAMMRRKQQEEQEQRQQLQRQALLRKRQQQQQHEEEQRRRAAILQQRQQEEEQRRRQEALLYQRQQEEERRRRRQAALSQQQQQRQTVSLEDALQALLGIREPQWTEDSEDEDEVMEHPPKEESVAATSNNTEDSEDEEDYYDLYNQDPITEQASQRSSTIKIPVIDSKADQQQSSQPSSSNNTHDVESDFSVSDMVNSLSTQLESNDKTDQDGDEEISNAPAPTASAAKSNNKALRNKARKQKQQKQHLKRQKQKENTNASSSSETETDQINLAETLKNIRNKVDNCVETYERIFHAEESSSSEEEYSVKSLSSRIKILQKTQMQLEQLYTKLDLLPKGEGENKKVRRDLTSKSVAVADKVDDLIRVLESHRTHLLEKEKREQEEADEEESSASVGTFTPKKNIRHVTIENVPDEEF